MRKIMLAAGCFLLSLIVVAQSSPRERIDELQILISQSFSDEDYTNGLNYILESIRLYEELDEETQSDYGYRNIPSYNYYDLACMYALLKKKKNALDAFDKSVELGYKDYRHACKDSDLDYLRKDKRFMRAMEQMRYMGDYMYILKQDHAYLPEERIDLPRFEYEDIGNWRIRNVKEYFKLDSVAGTGDELSRIIRVLNWVHNEIPHNGSHWPNCGIDAVDIYNYSKANNGKGVNCRALAIVLNECYQSLGFPARFITCLPKDSTDPDCHVINVVYSETLDKWVWMDPSFNAYIKDEAGTLLSIEEVRDRLIKDEPLFLNEDANWNNKNPQTKEYYLDHYMAKNLYWFKCPARSLFNIESNYWNRNETYISLIPTGSPMEANGNQVVTSDPAYFWQKP